MQLDKWLELWREAVEGEFGAQRVYFMGIQGSRARGEAREESDIDVVLILDALTAGGAVLLLPGHAACLRLAGRAGRARWRAGRAQGGARLGLRHIPRLRAQPHTRAQRGCARGAI